MKGFNDQNIQMAFYLRLYASNSTLMGYRMTRYEIQKTLNHSPQSIHKIRPAPLKNNHDGIRVYLEFFDSFWIVIFEMILEALKNYPKY